jgi:hypothetical protein
MRHVHLTVSALKALLPIRYQALKELMSHASIISLSSQVGHPDLQALGNECEFGIHDLARIVAC